MAGRGTTTRTPRCQLARVAERSWTTGRRKDELAAGASGKAGKGPLPKRPGRALYRAAADRRNTTRATTRESSRQAYRAGRSSTTIQLRKTDNACAQQRTPRIATALVPAMCPDSVPVLVLCRCSDRRLGLLWSASAPADRSLQERSARQEQPGRTAGRRRPPAPTSTPRRRRRAFTYSAQRRRRTATANVNGIAGPGAFYLPRALFVAADGAGALAV